MIIRVVAASAAGVMLLSGTAHAFPVKDAPELTHNEIYRKGALPKVSCKLDKGTSKASARKYAAKLVGCLNTAWKPVIADFQTVEVEFTDDKQSCGSRMDIAGSRAEICHTTIEIRLADDWIRAKSDAGMFAAITRAWSGVVTGQTGIGQAWWALQANGSEAEGKEQTRRYYLQADCFFGVSAKAVGRTVKDWKPLIAAMHPREYARFSWNGKPANRLTWIKQGYKAVKPGACNTWTASSAKVS